MKKWYITCMVLCLLPELYGDRSWGQAIDDSSYYRMPRFGIVGAANFIHHSSDFQALPGVPNCCTQFTSGSGVGYSAGLLYEHPTRGAWLLGGRIAFQHVPARFRSREATTFIIDGKATPGAFDHEIDAEYDIVWVHYIAGYRLFEINSGRLDIAAQAGIGAGIITGSSYSQRERIAEPEGVGEFIDTGEPVRNEASGTIPDISSLAAEITIGLGSNVKLNESRTLLLSPEIWFSVGLADVVPSLSWRTYELRVGAALKYIPR